jgi:hypothetical protein
MFRGARAEGYGVTRVRGPKFGASLTSDRKDLRQEAMRPSCQLGAIQCSVPCSCGPTRYRKPKEPDGETLPEIEHRSLDPEQLELRVVEDL